MNILITLKSLAISSAKASKSNALFGWVGLPSVNTIMTFGLSGLSPPASVNSSSLAIFRARSVRVWKFNCIGSLPIFFSRAALSWYSELANLNTIWAFLLNVMRPKWSASEEGLNFPTRFSRNSITSLRFEFPTLFDLSRTIPMSRPAVQRGAEGNKQNGVHDLDLIVTKYKWPWIWGYQMLRLKNSDFELLCKLLWITRWFYLISSMLFKLHWQNELTYVRNWLFFLFALGIRSLCVVNKCLSKLIGNTSLLLFLLL